MCHYYLDLLDMRMAHHLIHKCDSPTLLVKLPIIPGEEASKGELLYQYSTCVFNVHQSGPYNSRPVYYITPMKQCCLDYHVSYLVI